MLNGEQIEERGIKREEMEEGDKPLNQSLIVTLKHIYFLLQLSNSTNVLLDGSLLFQT